MSCANEFNKENVLSILDKYIELMRIDATEKAKNGDLSSMRHIENLMVTMAYIRNIKTEIKELEETYNSEIIELLDKINREYTTNLKLHSKNVIFAIHICSLLDDLYQYDICPDYNYYVFDVDDVVPILKKKVEEI